MTIDSMEIELDRDEVKFQRGRYFETISSTASDELQEAADLLSKIPLRYVGISSVFGGRRGFVVAEMEVVEELCPPEVLDAPIYDFLRSSRPHVSIARFERDDRMVDTIVRNTVDFTNKKFDQISELLHFVKVEVVQSYFGQRTVVLSARAKSCVRRVSF